MDSIIEFFTNGFSAALAKIQAEFTKQQEIRDVALSEKLTQILQGQQASQDAIAAINETITTETAEVTESLTKLTDLAATQAKTIEEQTQQIKDLLASVESGETELSEANQIIDEIAQKQQEQLVLQQEAASNISAIFINTPAS